MAGKDAVPAEPASKRETLSQDISRGLSEELARHERALRQLLEPQEGKAARGREGTPCSKPMPFPCLMKAETPGVQLEQFEAPQHPVHVAGASPSITGCETPVIPEHSADAKAAEPQGLAGRGRKRPSQLLTPIPSPMPQAHASGAKKPPARPETPQMTPNSEMFYSPRRMVRVPDPEEIKEARLRSGSTFASEAHAPSSSLSIRVRMVLNSSVSEYTMACFILANAAMFGVHADFAVKHPGEEFPSFYRGIDLAFLIVFATELVLRIVAAGMSFVRCSNPDFRWNVLDSFLVSFSFVEEMLRLFMADAPDVSSARLLRLLRLLRIVRVLRVLRFFKDLRVMVMGIMSSMKPLLWALLLLGLIMYSFAVCVLQFVAEELVMGSSGGAADMIFWSSLMRTIYTLFMCISGGISWVEVAEPLIVINPLLAPLFSLYIAFSVFCVLNIVTGVFVERSSTMAMQDEENMLFEEIESRKKWMAEMEQVFHRADKDGSGEIRWEEFKECLSDLRMQTCLKNMGIDLNRMGLRQIWEMLDFDNSGCMEISDFASGLQQLHGTAHSIDIARVRHDLKASQKKIAKLMTVCEQNFGYLAAVCTKQPSSMPSPVEEVPKAPKALRPFAKFPFLEEYVQANQEPLSTGHSSETACSL